MKKQLILLAFLCLFTNLSAQKNTTLKLPKSKIYNKLAGEIYTLCFFIDTQKDSWTEEEIEYYLLELESSQYWLAGEAYKYGVELEFNNDHFETTDELIEINTFATIKRGQLLQTVMLAIGYHDYKDFLDWSYFDLDNNRLAVLCFVKDRNRSHAISYRYGDNLDFAVLYASSTYGQITTQYTFSHELLHLFGAWDLYNGESQTLEKAKELSELFPNSIMINTWTNQEKLEVDPLTAWRVGWNNKPSDNFTSFVPDRKAAREEMDKKQREAKGKVLKFELGKKKRN